MSKKNLTIIIYNIDTIRYNICNEFHSSTHNPLNNSVMDYLRDNLFMDVMNQTNIQFYFQIKNSIHKILVGNQILGQIENE